jgi:NAD-dependent deacetylase
MDEGIARAADRLRAADTAVAFTGAGVSTASGIPDFRSDGGVWDRWDPMDFHVRRFERDPGGFWTDRAELVAEVYEDPEPNAAHRALADLEGAGRLDRVITQNVDGLHTRAGSKGVLEIHGTGDRVVCRACDRRYDAGPYYRAVGSGTLGGAPRCRECDGVLKPDVVLFGEPLPEGTFAHARRLAREADCLLVVGSSLTVEPAASLPEYTLKSGGNLVVVNLERTPLSDRAAVDLRADVTDALPAVRDALAADRG